MSIALISRGWKISTTPRWSGRHLGPDSVKKNSDPKIYQKRIANVLMVVFFSSMFKP